MRDNKGFILVAVIWVLAIISIAATFFATWVQRSLELNYNSREELRNEINLVGTRASVLYLLTTQRMTYSGLTTKAYANASAFMQVIGGEPDVQLEGGEIRLDGQPYEGMGGIRFAIQDERGLLNINSVDRDNLSRFLGLMGVPVEKRGGMLAKLDDYIDKDEVYRAEGGETAQYERAGLGKPANRRLFSVLELRNVLGWDFASFPVSSDLLVKNLSVSRNATINANTAPLEALMAGLKVSSPAAQRVIKARAVNPLKSPVELVRITGERTREEFDEVLYYPSRYQLLSFWAKGAGKQAEYQIELTTFLDGKTPWRVVRAATRDLKATGASKNSVNQTTRFSQSQALLPRD